MAAPHLSPLDDGPARSGTRRPFSRSYVAHRFTVVGCAMVLTTIMAWSLPREIQGGDAGEFATVLLRGGMPHPSGYPVMRWLGPGARLLEGLGVSPVCAAALLPAFAGVLGWTWLAALLSRWYAPIVAGLAVLLSACSSLAVVHGFDCEVWGPQLLLTAWVLHETIRPSRSPVRCGAALGLAVAHHLTGILLAPLVIAAQWPPSWRWREVAAQLVRVGGGAALGLLPMATLTLGREGAWRWGETSSLRGLVAHILREDYGVMSLGLHGADPSVWALWARVLESLGGSITAGLVANLWSALALLSIVLLIARRETSIPRPVWSALYVTFTITALVFPSLHNIDPSTPFARWILERFDLVPLFLLTVFVAAALDRVARRGRAATLLVVTFAMGMMTVQLLRTHGRGLPRHEAGVEAYARDVLVTPTEPNAIVFGTDDHRTFPILFAQEVLGSGPDVLYVDAQLMAHTWYIDRLRRRMPTFPRVDKPLAAIGRLWSDAQTRDTPIYLANVFSRPAREQLTLVPEGVLWRVVPPHAADSFDLATIEQRHRSACARYHARPEQFAGLRHAAAHPWSGDLWYAYQDGTAALVRQLHRSGERTTANALRNLALPCRLPTTPRAARLPPRSRPTLP